MVIVCQRCGLRDELRSGNKTGGSSARYYQRLKELRDSFLKCEVELCPRCQSDLLKFVRARPADEEMIRNAISPVRRARFTRRSSL